MSTIPVVDIGLLSENPTEADWELVSNEVADVLTSIGFIYLKNHGVPANIIETAFDKSRNFYAMPRDLKLKYKKDKSRNFGYLEPNQEILQKEKYKAELRESFDIPLMLMPELEKGDAIPECPDFFSALQNLALACHPLILTLNRILARSLDLEDLEYFNNVSKGILDGNVLTLTTIRSILYPSIGDAVVEEESIRCAPHSDYGTLSLLFQDDLGGLEIRGSDGSWILATPIDGTILVNTGDLLQLWSGGKFPATVHRVVIPELERKKRQSRQSLVYFIQPDNDVMVSPIGPHATQTDDPPVSALEHTLQRLAYSYQQETPPLCNFLLGKNE